MKPVAQNEKQTFLAQRAHTNLRTIEVQKEIAHLKPPQRTERMELLHPSEYVGSCAGGLLSTLPQLDEDGARRVPGDKWVNRVAVGRVQGAFGFNVEAWASPLRVSAE
jgi:hypothetical protein